jgi:hypothetical protein
MMTLAKARTPSSATGEDRETAAETFDSVQGGRPTWKSALTLTLLLRLTYSVSSVVIGLTQSVNWKLVHSNALTENLPPPDHSLHYLLIGIWERFDSLWYLHIAANGYDRPESLVFFPMYPALIRIMSVIMTPMAAALLISTVAAFFLFWGLQELLVVDLPSNLVHQSLIVCCVWPASFVFFAGYPEALLFSLIVWSLSMARGGRWMAAVALGVAAAMTKAVGVAVVIPLLLVAIRQNQKLKAISIVLIPVSSVAFLRYVQSTVHHTLAATYTQYWRTSALAPWTTLWASLRSLVHEPNPIIILNLIALFSMVLLVVRSRLRMEYVVYSAATIVAFLCKGTNPPLQSVVRYLLIIFPAFVGFAGIFRRPQMRSRFGMACSALFVINLGLLWLFLGWSLVL